MIILKSTTDSKEKSTAQYQWEALFSDESEDPHFLSKYVLRNVKSNGRILEECQKDDEIQYRELIMLCHQKS